ncbi:MAG: hypothetical protein WCP09_02735 [Candidatus Taylorbacteria bacterium]
MVNTEVRKAAIALRKRGKSYSDICNALNVSVPKSTMASWFAGIVLSKRAANILMKNAAINLAAAQKSGLQSIAEKRNAYLDKLKKENIHLCSLIVDVNVAKIALAMLYLAEGSKRGGFLTFANSDVAIIKLFLQLLRTCYKLYLEKFRCTVQCRADQVVPELEKYWSLITNIPLSQFCKAQIDSRTIGKSTRKEHYKGVCRITYYSADIFNELAIISKLINSGH